LRAGGVRTVQNGCEVVAVLPAASVTVSVIVPESISRIANEAVGDGVTRSGDNDVQLNSQLLIHTRL
jgi:hypothetical protein